MAINTISATNLPATPNNGRTTCRDSGSKLHVVYSRSDGVTRHIYYKSSADNGVTWVGEVKLTAGVKDYAYASIAVDSFDNLHVSFKNVTNNKLGYVKYTVGVGWGAQHDFLIAVNGIASNAISVGNDDSIFIAYRGSVLTNWWMWVRSEDGGATWTAEQTVNWGPDSYLCINTAPDTYGYIHIIISTDIFTILYWRFNLTTDLIDISATKLSPVANMHYEPDITCTPGGRVIVVWETSTNQIYWTYNDNNGLGTPGFGWLVSVGITTITLGRQYQPSIAAVADNTYSLIWRYVDGGAIYQVWGKEYAGAWGAEAKYTTEALHVNGLRLTGSAYPVTAHFPAHYGYSYAREDGSYVNYDNDSLGPIPPGPPTFGGGINRRDRPYRRF